MALSVLVVDDDPVILRLLQVNFELEGIGVVTAVDGDEGLKLAQSDPPDLVISDIMMPRVNGLELLAALRSSPDTASMPVILLSAKAQVADVQRGLELGADDYVTKPFSIGELVARIKAIFRRLHRAPPANEQIVIGAATVDPLKHELVRKGKVSALSFYEVGDGRITSAREYWVLEAYEEPGAERARWFEPM